MPQTGWPKTTEIYYLIVLEIRSPKSRYQQGVFVYFKLLRQNPVHASLLASGSAGNS